MEQTAPHDQRSGKRLTLVLRAAKLVCPAGEFLCILRDVSAGGIKLRLFHSLPEARPLEIDLDNGMRFGVEPVWQRGDQAGFRFTGGAVVMAELLSDDAAFPRRGMRLRAELPVKIAGPSGSVEGRLLDISLDGARIECPKQFPLASRLRIESGRFPAIIGKVCWRTGDAHGIALEHHFALDELARMLSPEKPDISGNLAKIAAR